MSRGIDNQDIESHTRRFWPKVQKLDGNRCWEWQAGCFARGYGCFAYGRNKPGYAHRYSYELHYGPIPEGLVIMHTCDNVKCVNPAHLQAGTQKENIHDAISKQRWMTPARRSYLKNPGNQRDSNGRWLPGRDFP